MHDINCGCVKMGRTKQKQNTKNKKIMRQNRLLFLFFSYRVILFDCSGIGFFLCSLD